METLRAIQKDDIVTVRLKVTSPGVSCLRVQKITNRFDNPSIFIDIEDVISVEDPPIQIGDTVWYPSFECPNEGVTLLHIHPNKDEIGRRWATVADGGGMPRVVPFVKLRRTR